MRATSAAAINSMASGTSVSRTGSWGAGESSAQRDSEREAEGTRVQSGEEAAPSCFSSLEGQGALGVQLLLFQGFIYLFVLPTYGG